MAEIEVLHRRGGTGDISPTSAGLATDVLAFFLDSYRAMMQPWEAGAVESAIAKLSAAAASN
jgi:hypothetical protein